MDKYISKELLDKCQLTELELEEYLSLYGKTLYIFSCMSTRTQIAWCEEARLYKFQQKELNRRRNRK